MGSTLDALGWIRARRTLRLAATVAKIEREDPASPRSAEARMVEDVVRPRRGLVAAHTPKMRRSHRALERRHLAWRVAKSQPISGASCSRFLARTARVGHVTLLYTPISPRCWNIISLRYAPIIYVPRITHTLITPFAADTNRRSDLWSRQRRQPADTYTPSG